MNLKNQQKTLRLAEIRISATNPRKHFDQAALEELAQGIKKVGVLHPIVVRPVEKNYELVCGERRYRASEMAGMTVIPANIRILTDDEAFELQIMENLERKDVHPMDEAEAFQKMLDTGRYTLQDLAAKFVKPESFIAQRLSLCHLIPQIKQDFYNAQLGIGHAILIARMPEDRQQEIFAGYKDKQVDGYGTVRELEKEIREETIPMVKAKFSLEKPYGPIVACSACPKRTANNLILFPDMQDADSCTDKSCFRKKLDLHVTQQLEEIINSGKPVTLAGNTKGSPSAGVQEMAAAYDLKINKEYQDIFPNKNAIHAEEVEVFYVDGEKVGTWGKAYRPADKTAVSPALTETYTELDRLKDRAQRNKELDKQKLHGQIVEALRMEFEKQQEQPITLTDHFVDAMFIYMALNNAELHYLAEDIRALGYDIKYDTLENFLQFVKPLSSEQRKQICALALFRKCKGSTTHETFFGKIIMLLAIGHKDIDVEKMTVEHEAIVKVRIEKENAKIKEMEEAQAKPIQSALKKGIQALLGDKESKAK
ncbi:ParB/RepB/Spo0J family partition protein [Flavobacterium rhizosphaerae]|uniref:ParB/RepB/Spo0J family partition protein n=1 Tax=Flavobacterium rhizosphaerae TaxID=3163298 RepID=A0ABW8YWN4_9FLAO